jgi:uncharacterized protein (TIGR03083 family)
VRFVSRCGCLNAQVELDAAYTGVQEHWLAALAGTSAGDTPVPACPEWTVRDVMAHVAGLAEDAVAGSFPDIDLLEQWRDDAVAAGRDAMTARQVERAGTEPIDEIIERWRAAGAVLAPMLRGDEPFPEGAPFGLSAILVTDVTVHAQDVLAAIHADQLRQGAAVSVAIAAYGFGVDYRVRALGLPALAIAYDGKERVIGDPDGPIGARLAASRYEIMRALAGRRSRAQIAAFDWQGDRGSYLALIPAYGERDDPLED